MRFRRSGSGSPAFVGLGWAIATTSFAATLEEDFIGRAVDPQGRLVYVENHHAVYEDGKVKHAETFYFDPAGAPIAKLVTTYADGPSMPDLVYEDTRLKSSEGARIANGRVELWRRPTGAKEERNRSFTIQPNDVIGQGVHEAIRLRLKELVDGSVLRYRLFLPIRLDWFTFKISRVDLNGNLMRLHMEPENWLIRFLAPHIETVYDVPTGHLVRYEGPSNILDGEGRTQMVTMTFAYPADVSDLRAPTSISSPTK